MRLFLLASLVVLTQLTVAQTSTQTKHQATLAQQKMCREQAHKSAAEYYPTDPADTKTTILLYSHYDPETNVCYLLTRQTRIRHDHKISVDETVDDAFEGQSYGLYEDYGEGRTDQCLVIPLGHEKISCASQDEFHKLVLKYFAVRF